MTVNLQDPLLERAVDVIDELLDILEAEGLTTDALTAVLPDAGETMGDEIDALLTTLSEAKDVAETYHRAWRAAETIRLGC